MIYTNLSTTDLKVSKICLGTMTWGRQNTQEEGFEQMNYALDQGVNFWDTAELYPVPATAERYAHTEIIIGNWLKETKRRSEIVLATKIAGKAAFTSHIRTTGFQSQSLIEAVDQSLERLQTDYIDLYQLHWPERVTNFFGKRDYPIGETCEWEDNIAEVLGTLEKIVASGKVRYIGLSNETPWGLMRFLEEHAANFKLPRVVSVQNPYSLLNRLYEVGMAEMSMRSEAGLLAYSPLGFGVLSGKYLGGKKPENARVTLFPNFSRYSGGNSLKATEMYKEVADAHGLSLTQLSLAFVNTRPFVTSNIIGATSISQLKENIESVNVKWNQELEDAVNAIHGQIPNPAP